MWVDNVKQYAHSTIVQPLTTIRVERMLPNAGKVVARVGQTVSAAQIVARTPEGSNFRVLPVAKALGIPPHQLKKYLLVKKGDRIDEGMVLVSKKGFRTREYTSPLDGRLYDINAGRLIVQYRSGWIEVRAMVSGTVVERERERGVTIELTGSRIQGVWSSRRETFGKLMVLSSMGNMPLAPFQLNEEAAERVLVVGRITDMKPLEMAAEIGIRGLIAGSVTAELTTAVKRLPYAVIITDGIGQQPMAQPIMQLLQNGDNQLTSILGRQPRPEIIIAAKEGSSAIVTPVPEPKIVEVGQIVRVLQAPHYGEVGEIVNIYDKMQLMAINARAYGVAVQLRTGPLVFVPYANLDVIIG